MKRNLLPTAAIPTWALILTACGGTVSDEYEIEEQPYTLETIEGEDVLRVALTEEAVQHIGIETVAVEAKWREVGRAATARCTSTPTESSGCTPTPSRSSSSAPR